MLPYPPCRNSVQRQHKCRRTRYVCCARMHGVICSPSVALEYGAGFQPLFRQESGHTPQDALSHPVDITPPLESCLHVLAHSFLAKNALTPPDITPPPKVRYGALAPILSGGTLNTTPLCNTTPGDNFSIPQTWYHRGLFHRRHRR